MELKISKELYKKPKRTVVPLKTIESIKPGKERLVIYKSVLGQIRPKADASVSSNWFVNIFKKKAKSRYSLEEDNLNF